MRLLSRKKQENGGDLANSLAWTILKKRQRIKSRQIPSLTVPGMGRSWRISRSLPSGFSSRNNSTRRALARIVERYSGTPNGFNGIMDDPLPFGIWAPRTCSTGRWMRIRSGFEVTIIGRHRPPAISTSPFSESKRQRDSYGGNCYSTKGSPKSNTSKARLTKFGRFRSATSLGSMRRHGRNGRPGWDGWLRRGPCWSVKKGDRSGCGPLSV